MLWPIQELHWKWNQSWPSCSNQTILDYWHPWPDPSWFPTHEKRSCWTNDRFNAYWDQQVLLLECKKIYPSICSQRQRRKIKNRNHANSRSTIWRLWIKHLYWPWTSWFLEKLCLKLQRINETKSSYLQQSYIEFDLTLVKIRKHVFLTIALKTWLTIKYQSIYKNVRWPPLRS